MKLKAGLARDLQDAVQPFLLLFRAEFAHVADQPLGDELAHLSRDLAAGRDPLRHFRYNPILILLIFFVEPT